MHRIHPQAKLTVTSIVAAMKPIRAKKEVSSVLSRSRVVSGVGIVSLGGEEPFAS